MLRGAGDGQNLREHLIATAERLISSRGTAALTVREIAREAGVADGVLYNYFDGKEDLLANAVAAHVRTIQAGLGDLPRPGEGDLAENLRTHVRYGIALHRALLSFMAGLRPESEAVSRFTGLVGPDTNWRDELLRYLHAERDLGRLAPDAPVEAAAAMIVGVCHELVLTLLLPDGAHAGIFAAPPDAGDVVAVILDGMRPRRERSDAMNATRRFRIAAIPADGVGKEVVAAGRQVLDALAAGTPTASSPSTGRDFPWGCEYYEQTGRMMDRRRPRDPEGLRRHLLRRRRLAKRPRPHQPVGPAAEHHARTSTSGPTSARSSSSPASESPLRKADDTELDWVVVRENSEGEYAGHRRPQPLRPRPGQRGRPADRPVHREGLRADHALRLRPGPHPHA